MNSRNITIISLILLAISTRLIPHWPNFTAVGAAALFGGAMFKNGFKAFLIPLVALFLSDLIINNIIYASYYDGFQWFTQDFGFMYIGFLLTVLIGRIGIKGYKPLPILGGVLISSLLFFLITNFGFWRSSLLYPQTFAGLIEGYIAGIPFLLRQLASTALYSGILFTVASFILSPRLSPSPARA